jgi:ABC-type transporter Mla subunit MlaD|tara:strand:+ start:290 stop:421 length:132 start_codon:yes stop_codon:yes gene_type:complete
MIEGKGKKSMWMGIFGVAFAVAVGILGANYAQKNFIDKDETEA